MKENQKKGKEANLGQDPVGGLLFKLALPAILAQLINVLYNMVDRMYIGHIPVEGKLALTGVGVCLPLIMIISAFACLVSMGGAPRASIFLGKGDNKSAEKTLGIPLCISHFHRRKPACVRRGPVSRRAVGSHASRAPQFLYRFREPVPRRKPSRIPAGCQTFQMAGRRKSDHYRY